MLLLLLLLLLLHNAIPTGKKVISSLYIYIYNINKYIYIIKNTYTHIYIYICLYIYFIIYIYIIPYISVYKSRNLSQNKILHRQIVLYTGNTLREEIIPKASWIFKVRAHHDSAVGSDNARIDEFSIAPLVYHLYTNPFLCYSWDIIS